MANGQRARVAKVTPAVTSNYMLALLPLAWLAKRYIPEPPGMMEEARTGGTARRLNRDIRFWLSKSCLNPGDPVDPRVVPRQYPDHHE